ncbi:putative ribonuclease H-like domain-containing protein [Tanacetum coccineum]|uniref:Ribonuclease H-like domain-containing protein n=1 Tax=Tanacetum coccineum TaxID=301880 RepID=A0ABQ4Z7N0_9ASTR
MPTGASMTKAMYLMARKQILARVSNWVFKAKAYQVHFKGIIAKVLHQRTLPLRYMKMRVLQMDVKSAFLYGTIEEEVYVKQPRGFEDPEYPQRVYKVEKAMYGLHQAPRAWYGTLSKYLLENGFQRGLQVSQRKNGIFLSQDKYVGDILKKFGYTYVRTAKTPIDREYPWGKYGPRKDGPRKDMDLHLYRSMIGSLMYLTASRPDIMFAICICARHQVTPKKCHLHAVKRIFSDYDGDNQDRKSTTRGYQFFERRLISWQCKKQTIVATSTTEAEYVAVASCCGQVLWIQNQLLDYGYNFMNTKIYNDNNSAICIVKNPIYHSRIKHIDIRHHFIRDCYEKKLINVDHIHTDDNVADLLTKPFDAGRFQYLVDEHVMIRCICEKRHHFLRDSYEKKFNSLDASIDETVHKELGDRMKRAATTVSSFEAKQDSDAQTRLKLVELVQKINDQEPIQALVDKKKIIINEDNIKRDLKLDDTEGSTCLPNATIFEELARMGYEKPSQRLTFYKAYFSPQWKFLIHPILHCLSVKTTTWNEFNSTMASFIICLANNQKFNYSKYMLDHLVNHLEGDVKYYLFLRFVQLFLNKQVAGLNKHKDSFVVSSHTKKFFANMKRQSNGFSGNVTPLFDTLMVQAIEDVGEDSDHSADQTPIHDQPSTSSNTKKKLKPRRK